ncbi:MAG: hypothetical protein J6Z38_08555 [Lachnospiraceae bacterium]|nr:hypothetical protein [Lachnospiraceae bacterium]
MEDRREELKNSPSGTASFAPEKLYLLVTVVQKGKGTFFADFLQTFGSNLQVCMVGTGTARQDLVEFLGLKDNKRSVIFGVVSEEKLDPILEALEDRFYTVNGKTGIAFAVPLSSVIGKLSYGFLSNDPRMVRGEEANG